MWLTFDITSSIPTPMLGNIYRRNLEIREVRFLLLQFCYLNFSDLLYKVVLLPVFQVYSL